MRYFYFKDLSSESNKQHLIYESRKSSESEHIHDFVEILYINSGKMIQKINEKEFFVSRGDVLIIKPNSTHSFIPINQSSYFNICLNSDLLKNYNIIVNLFLENKDDVFEKVIRFDGEDRLEIEHILQYMLHEQIIADPYYEDIMDAYLKILSSLIIRKASNNQDEAKHWRDFEYFIKQNLDTQLTLEDVASRFFYNPSYFSRLFKEKFGVNFSTYVSATRLEKSKELLCKTSKSIKEIANETGFSSSSAFCRLFLKKNHCSPLEYRKNNK